MNLFVYGTLMFPEIWDMITGLPDTRREPANLNDFAIYRVKGATFPGVVRNDGTYVSGQLIFDLSDETMQRLDDYEDNFYVRSPVTVVLATTKEVLSAVVYEVPGEYASGILSGDYWTREWFEQNAYDDYIARMTGRR